MYFEKIDQILAPQESILLKRLKDHLQSSNEFVIRPFKNKVDHEHWILPYIQNIYNVMANRLHMKLGPNISLVADKLIFRRAIVTKRYSDRPQVQQPYFGWHQDSNHTYLSKPMIVAWVPMEDGCGVNKPSLNILCTNRIVDTYEEWVNEWRFDQTKLAPTLDQLLNFYGSSHTCIYQPKCNLGDILLFDGLTIHCTSFIKGMKPDRSALILRFLPTKNEDMGFGKDYLRFRR